MEEGLQYIHEMLSGVHTFSPLHSPLPLHNNFIKLVGTTTEYIARHRPKRLNT
jgi:hypothetical protein